MAEDGSTLFVGDETFSHDQPRWDGEKSAILGIRPESIVHGDGEGLNFTAETRFVEPLGAESLVHLAIAGGQGIVMRVNGVAADQPGARRRLHVPYQALHRFNAVTGKRLDA